MAATLARPFIFFDVGGTLLHFRPSLGVSLDRVARDAGASLGAEDPERAAAIADGRVGGSPHPIDLDLNRRWWFDFYREFLEAMQCEGDALALCEAFWTGHCAGDFFVADDDAVPTLQALAARGHRLGVISNFDDTLRTILERRSLLSFFDVVVVSCEVKLAKPDPAIFRLALNLGGIDASNAIHVGDHPIFDVDGARSAGLRPVYIGMNSTVDGTDRVERLSGLLDLL